jgi:hypothetical protein
MKEESRRCERLQFINATTTKSGLQIKAKLDEYEYETRKKVSEEQMGQVHVQPHKTHPAWNYTIQRKYHKIK